jgi:hypothetical protein
MKKPFIFLLSFFTLTVMSCEEINPNVDYAPASANYPFISSFTPLSAECGAEISILGENLGTSLSDTFVTFDTFGSPAFSGRISEVTQVHENRILIRVPMNLVPGDYTISVEVEGQTSSSVHLFRIL